MQPFAGVALLSAFLLFLVQPLIAKAILPWFGGAPAVWTTCLLFFQTLLLAGYAYTHLTKRLGPRRQAWLHATLLLLTLAALPIAPSAAWKPTGTEPPVWRILGLLSVSVGAPYLMLATSAPLLQDWYGRSAAAGSPYRLYAWSNTGSLLALLSYPFVVERVLPVDGQAHAWSLAYALFVAACCWIALAPRPALAGGQRVGPSSGRDSDIEPSNGERALWFALSACGSGLLLSVTNLLTLDVAAVPFLWVLPLALYLTSFILCFAGRYHRELWRPLYTVGLGVMAILAKTGSSVSLPWQIAGAAGTLFAGCMICHGELARLIPRARHLTSFYLIMAAGGAAGGILVGLVAPLLLSDFWEVPVFLLLPYMLLLAIFLRDPQSSRSTWRRALAVAAAGAVLWLGVTAFVLPALRGSGTEVATARNFYGVLRISDDEPLPNAMRRLKHGRIEHGTQFLDPARRGVATAYYAEQSGADFAIRQHPRRVAGQPLRIAAVGLGAGTIAAWGLPGDTIRFYEINPTVTDFARRYFTFLKDSRAAVEVVAGDGRLSLERELAEPRARHRYDVLVLDAFSGDAIPVHLLTLECAAVYGQALKDDGILAVHVSNLHLNLVPVVSALGEASGRKAIRIHRNQGAAAQSSTWVLVTSNEAFLRGLRAGPAAFADYPAERPVRWTDRYSNLFEVLSPDL